MKMMMMMMLIRMMMVMMMYFSTGLEALILTQEKSLSVNLEDNIKIPCVVTDSSTTWVISWYQQKAGGGPSFLLADSSRATGLPTRFTYSESGSGYTENLHINGITAEDEAVYICACHGCGDLHSDAVQLSAWTKSHWGFSLDNNAE
uniref:Ig-like domain-containing protein n=1 Tax=Esox lucius TaxID=8010 RepID=A0AAY5L0V0_ESOLU